MFACTIQSRASRTHVLHALSSYALVIISSIYIYIYIDSCTKQFIHQPPLLSFSLKVSGTGPPSQTDKSDNTEINNVADSRFPYSDSNTPDSVTADDTLDLDFCESSLTRPPNPEDFYRLPFKYHGLYKYRTLDELTFDHHSPWPTDLPWNLNLSATPLIWNQLPSQNLIRTGQVVCILRKNPRSRRLVGQLAFFQRRTGRITRSTPPLPVDAPADDAICLFVPNSVNHTLVKPDPATIPKSNVSCFFLLYRDKQYERILSFHLTITIGFLMPWVFEKANKLDG